MATESTSWGTFKGLFAFFILLPIGSCVACSMCVAVAGSGSTPSTTQASPPPVDSALFVVPVGGQCRIPDDCVVGAECLSDLRTDAAARSGIKLCFNMSDADPKPKHPKHLRVSGHPYPDGHGGYHHDFVRPDPRRIILGNHNEQQRQHPGRVVLGIRDQRKRRRHRGGNLLRFRG